MRPQTLKFTRCPKTFSADLDKAVSPEQTLATFHRRIEALDLQILAEVKRIDTGRLGIPVYFGVCADDARTIIGANKTMGKGATAVQAKTSACMELTERFSFFTFKENSHHFLSGDYAAMKAAGHPVLPLTALLNSVHDTVLSEEQLAALVDGLDMEWCFATNITTGEPVLLPFSWFYTINEFNGTSAGNTLEEAAMQGLCEVIERHVCSRVSHEKLVVPRIDPASVTDPVAVDLLQKYADNTIELHLFDFSLDTGIPTVAALAIDRSTFPRRSEIVFTAGTAANPQKALIRALTEVAQLAGDFETGASYIASGLPKPQEMEDVAWLTATPRTIAVSEMPDLSTTDIRVELDRAVAALKRIGLEVLMVDITNPELGLPAIYTLVPGCHFRERSRLDSAGLFAARLTVEQSKNPAELDLRLAALESLLPGAYYLQFYRGRNLCSCGQSEQAAAFFARALELVQQTKEKTGPGAEDLPAICSWYGLCLRDLHRYDEALHVLEIGLEVDDQRPDIYNTMGVCCFQIGDYEQAVEKFKRAVELDPSSAMDYANIGVNCGRLGRNDEAREYLTLALTLDPSLDFARDLLASLEQ